MFVAIVIGLLLQLPATADRAGIEGIVSNAVTGEPLAQAQITVVRSGGSLESAAVNPVSAMSDANGKFRLPDLPPGTYRLFGVRNGFSSQEYGQRSRGGIGTQLTVAKGEVLKNILFRLVPAATLTGRITDAAGQPLALAGVTLLRSTYDEHGRRQLIPAKSAQSDDRGEYRLFWIPAGHYFLSAVPAPSVADSIAGMEIGFDVRFSGAPRPDSSDLVAGVIRNQAVVSLSSALTYYPSTVDVSRAVPIDVRPGDELAALDIRMDPQPMFRIRGHVFDEKGRPARSANIGIGPRTPNGGTSKNATYTPATGLFEIRDVVAGSYLLSAMSGDMAGLMMVAIAELSDPDHPLTPQVRSLAANAPTPLSAHQFIEVSSDIDDAVLRFTSGFPINGQLTVSGMASVQELAGAARLRVGLESTADGIADLILPATVSANGEFTIKGLAPGSYRVYLDLPANVYIKSARLGTADVLDGSVTISEPVAETLRIEISPNTGTIEGSVRDAESKPLESIQTVLIPDKRERHDLYKTATSEPGGRVVFHGVPPGSYKLFAWEDLEANAWYDPVTLMKYEAQGKTITVSESETVRVDLRSIR
jgi:hypothetical protein